MGTSPGLINLDNLIENLEDEEYEPVVLKISDNLPENLTETHDREQDLGSDSSYGEFAWSVSENMDNMIAEAILDRDEKTKRITAARNAKAKELQEKQKSFAHGKKPKQPSSDKPNESKKKFKKGPTKKNEKVSKDTIKIVTKSEKTGEHVTDASSLSSKLKNVTIQNFGIESTPSQSDDETNLNLDDYNKLLIGYQKGFAVRSLNRSEKDNSCKSSDSSDDEDSETAKPSHFNPMKKMNYLKKRRNLKKNRSLKERALEKQGKVESTTDSSRDPVPVNLNPVKNERSIDESRSKKQTGKKQDDSNKAPVKKHNAERRIQTKRIEKENKSNSGKTIEQKDSSPVLNSFDFEAQTSKDKSYHSSGYQNRKNRKSLVDKGTGGKDEFNKFSGSSKSKSVSKTETKDNAVPSSSKSKVNPLQINKITDFDFDEDEQPSIISIVDLKQSPRDDKQEKTDDDPLFRFERLSLSSDNEIDWKAMDELKRQRNISTTDSVSRNNESDDDIEINFKSIVERRKMKNSSVLVPDVNVATCSSTNDQRNDSSSDYEDKIDAFLDHFK